MGALARGLAPTSYTTTRDTTECEHALRALRALEDLDFARGEQVMMWAAWPVMRHLPAVLAKLRSQYVQMNTAELRARFEQAVRKIV